jgi:hypothetical protein
MTSQTGTAPVEVITQHHCYRGLLVSRGCRVADVLNDPSSDLIEMREVAGTAQAAIAREVHYEQVFLSKSHILLVVPRGNHEAPLARRNKYVEKERYGAMVALPGYTFSGILHLPTRSDALTLLRTNSSLPGFLGLTEATVHVSLHGFLDSPCDVLVLRRAAIESIQMTRMPLPKPSGERPTAGAAR